MKDERQIKLKSWHASQEFGMDPPQAEAFHQSKSSSGHLERAYEVKVLVPATHKCSVICNSKTINAYLFPFSWFYNLIHSVLSIPWNFGSPPFLCLSLFQSDMTQVLLFKEVHLSWLTKKTRTQTGLQMTFSHCGYYKGVFGSQDVRLS